MSKLDLMFIMRLLSAMESAMFTAKVPMPEHLPARVGDAIAMLEEAILYQPGSLKLESNGAGYGKLPSEKLEVTK